MFALHVNMILLCDIKSRRFIRLIISSIPLPHIAPADRGIEKHMGVWE